MRRGLSGEENGVKWGEMGVKWGVQRKREREGEGDDPPDGAKSQGEEDQGRKREEEEESTRDAGALAQDTRRANSTHSRYNEFKTTLQNWMTTVEKKTQTQKKAPTHKQQQRGERGE